MNCKSFLSVKIGFCLKGLGFMWCFLIFGAVYCVRGSTHVDLTS